MTRATAARTLDSLSTLSGFRTFLTSTKTLCWSKRVVWRQPRADGGLAVALDSLQPSFQDALERSSQGCSTTLPPRTG